MNSQMKVIQEQENLHTSVEKLTNKDSNCELFKTHQIEETPFTIVEIEEGYIGVIGNHRITKVYENKEECEKELKEFSWNRVTQVIWAIVEKFTKININELN